MIHHAICYIIHVTMIITIMACRYTVTQHIIICDTNLYYVIVCYMLKPYHSILHYAMSCYCMLCYITLYYLGPRRLHEVDRGGAALREGRDTTS